MIRAVTFDFWNTIAQVPPDTMTEARRRAVAAACEDCEVEVETERLAALLAEVGSRYQRSWEVGAHFHPSEGAQMLVRALGAAGAAGEDLLDHFSGWGFSDEVGHYKPSPQIFEAALGALGARPEEAIHVGDLRRTDVAGAAELGMRTARYRGLHDDAESAGPEAEFLLDSHGELPGILDRI
jgi:HAD superfamily hydrolase (TIGR01509 family)